MVRPHAGFAVGSESLVGRTAARRPYKEVPSAVSSLKICIGQCEYFDLSRESAVTARHKVIEIVAKLRYVEELAANGRTISDCLREIGLTEVTYYRWRNRYGGLESDQAERLMDLEAEITRLRRAVSDLTLDKLILVEATTGSLTPELRSSYVLHAKTVLGISERRACQALGQHRSTQRKIQARLSLERNSADQSI